MQQQIQDKLIKEGYNWEEECNWWSRVWHTDTQEGEETITEAYKQSSDGCWKHLMIGYGENVFYEEDVIM